MRAAARRFRGGERVGGGVTRNGGIFFHVQLASGQGMPMHASIAAAKGAVEGLARSLAAEWAPKIRVNCVAPALTETPLTSRFFASTETREAMAAKHPLGRTGQPQDLATITRFLLSPESSWMTGQVIGVDGGLSTVLTRQKI